MLQIYDEDMPCFRKPSLKWINSFATCEKSILKIIVCIHRDPFNLVHIMFWGNSCHRLRVRDFNINHCQCYVVLLKTSFEYVQMFHFL